VLSRSQTGDRITVTWSIPTLSQARGFLSYTITFQSSDPSTRRRRQSATECFSSPCTALVDQGTIDILGLDPSTGYDVTVTPANELGEQGPPLTSLSEAVATGPDIAIIAAAAAGGGVVFILLLLIVLVCCW